MLCPRTMRYSGMYTIAKVPKDGRRAGMRYLPPASRLPCRRPGVAPRWSRLPWRLCWLPPLWLCRVGCLGQWSILEPVPDVHSPVVRYCVIYLLLSATKFSLHDSPYPRAPPPHAVAQNIGTAQAAIDSNCCESKDYDIYENLIS
jgi:hypothetical protein